MITDKIASWSPDLAWLRRPPPFLLFGKWSNVLSSTWSQKNCTWLRRSPPGVRILLLWFAHIANVNLGAEKFWSDSTFSHDAFWSGRSPFRCHRWGRGTVGDPSDLPELHHIVSWRGEELKTHWPICWGPSISRQSTGEGHCRLF